MKNKTTILLLVFAVIAAGIFSCDVSLGERLNLEGPIVEIHTPLSRQAVDGTFSMSGTVNAKNNSTIKEVLVKIRYNQEIPGKPGEFENIEHNVQWRYRNSVWEVSGNRGASWQPVPSVTIDEIEITPKWIGDNKSASWELPIDMKLFGSNLEDGQYQFSVTAWDNADNSDDNSFRTRMVILNNSDPKVEIFIPELYDKSDLGDTSSELYKFHQINDNDEEAIKTRRTAANIGKFVTGPMTLQFQIDSTADIWAIDIRFYEFDKDWKETDKENYIYKFQINDFDKRPTVPNVEDTLHPFYKLDIRDLTSSTFLNNNISSIGTGRLEELKKSITEKTTLRVVVRCIDSSGREPGKEDEEEVEERDHGFFIYWPKADIPWLELPANLLNTHPATVPDPENYKLYTMYPTTVVPIKAFDNNGVEKVEYKVFTVNPDTGIIGAQYGATQEERDESEPRIFSFSFSAPTPVVSGHYYLEATVFDNHAGAAKKSDTFTGYFVVVDISYPEIDPPQEPLASNPLFMHIKADPNITNPGIEDWYIDIRGFAYDNFRIRDVSMAWINPRSAGYAAMSQLAFFRDSKYGDTAKTIGATTLPAETYGWFVANAVTPGKDHGFDLNYPNLVWFMDLTPDAEAAPVDRDGVVYKEYEYSKKIYLKDLDIGPGMMWTNSNRDTMVQVPLNMTNQEKEANKDLIMSYLKSQVFVLKATDNDGKATIIIWSPQGDSRPPSIRINNKANNGVGIQRWNTVTSSYGPITYLSLDGDDAHLEQFNERDKIIITGTWEEDSAGSSIPNFEDSFLKENLRISVNNINVPKEIFYNDLSKTSGTWRVEVEVQPETAGQGVIKPGNLIDTLVIYANFIDLGGNPSEHTASWLVESQRLRLLRVGSNTSDGFFKEGDSMEIFIEFNKPVKLVNPAAPPQLALNTTGGAIGVATYDITNPGYVAEGSVRQYFKYTVVSGQTSDHLQVTGISASAQWESTVDDDTIIVSETSADLLNKLPVSTDRIGNTSEYMRSLMGARTFRIDTIPPRAPAVTSVPASGFMRIGETLFITLAFTNLDGSNDLIMFDNESPPALMLNIRNTSGGDTRTGITTENVSVQSNRLVFSYTIKVNDYSGNAPGSIGQVQITGINNNTISDLAGNLLTDTSTIIRTLTGLTVDSILPNPPGLRIVSNDTGSYISVGDSNGSTDPWTNFTSPPGLNDLGTIFFRNLEIEVTLPSQTTGKAMEQFIEYSLNNGRTWNQYPENPSAPLVSPILIPIESNGLSQVSVRLVDRAGNHSRWAQPISFVWDDGALLELMTTSASNGVKTNTILAGLDRLDVIPIIMTFRYPVEITAIEFTLNVGNRETDTKPYNRIFNPFADPMPPEKPAEMVLEPLVVSSTDKRTWTFNYYVRPTDTTVDASGRDRFEIKAMSITARLLTSALIDYSPPLDISDMIKIEGINKIHEDKEIYIQTGYVELEAGYPRFETGTRVNDDSYHSFLSIRFTTPVFRGGNASIRIVQNSAGYRLPAVLTETQRNRYRGVLNNHMNTEDMQEELGEDEFIFDRYYERGTNGFTSVNTTTGFPDTTIKYILKFDIDTYNVAPNQNGTDIERFAYAFLQAESINLLINSSAVTMFSDREVRVNLSEANALKVIGANYHVSFSGGLVFDAVGNPSQAFDSIEAGRTFTTSLRVATPSVRIFKPQETIEVRAANTTTARIHAIQPGEAQVRMDCRTPGSRVTYYTNSSNVGNDTTVRWNTAYFATYTPPTSAGIPQQPTDPIAVIANIGTVPKVTPGTGRPANNTRYLFGRTDLGPEPTLTIGPAPAASGLYEGYKLLIRAAGVVNAGAALADLSAISAQEMAYRTVIEFRGVSAAAQANYYDANTFGNGAGYQLWIRGGNTVNSTTIPGFPLTISDDWKDLEDNKKRAGIRLMSKTSGTAANSLQTSTWQYVTWDMNAVAFFDVYVGYDDTVVNLGDAAEKKAFEDRIFQYGPKFIARHLGEWSTLKQYYAAVHGERRLLQNTSPAFDNQLPYHFGLTNFVERPNGMLVTRPQ